ncbi:hypothetical protein B9Q03_05970 [Candidatus Marsarchaeota G2 archaeon OSP_D]|uniref:Archaeal Type IV pilin N-terminal domain-containing protein n=1 Tax=Candidatus Marsarchaeota G2 archaeon OSP_D TaxID=1978157 RepID=A0A2R6AWU0_9ARCH|nr:MAG: hypothetical protein B9Q03_05970 [Candidatus Marsarchaeota G2 archaeon OSP_D]
MTIQKVNKVRAKRSKRGISEMIAAIILVIITIAIGAGVYIYVTGLVSHNQVKNALQITEVSLTGGDLSITVQNTGSLTINSLKVYFNGVAAASATSITLSPGQSYSTVLTGLTATPGNEYPVYVTATTVNGGTIASPVVNVLSQ